MEYGKNLNIVSKKINEFVLKVGYIYKKIYIRASQDTFCKVSNLFGVRLFIFINNGTKKYIIIYLKSGQRLFNFQG